VSFAVLGLLPSFASTLYYGMGYAGTAGMTWGWLIAMSGIFAIAASMAELASSMPTSGVSEVLERTSTRLGLTD
jgi:amino acid transporter